MYYQIIDTMRFNEKINFMKSKLILLCFFTWLTSNGQEIQNEGVYQSKVPVEYWRILSDSDKHLEAASELLFRIQTDSATNRHSDYWHIAQMYGCLNDYKKAVFYLNQSMIGLTEEGDEQFWWYYKGTLAFFMRDKNTLEYFASKLEKSHTQYYKANSEMLSRLTKNFHLNYCEATK